VRGTDWQPRFEDPEVQEYLKEAAGPDGAQLFKFILDREPIGSVDILESHAERPASQVRKLLYRLMQAHALEYEKDTDAKGWETFTWRTDLPEVKIIHVRRWQDELSHLRVQVRFEKDHEFYSCESRHRRITFEDALDLEFQCPVCHEPMNPVDNSEVVAALEARVHELDRALAS
jgi:transcription initiation factor TFIIE subunit alpha